MEKIDTLLHPSWIIPIRPREVVLANHSVAIHQNKIVEILPRELAEGKYEAGKCVDLTGQVVLPGFINCHSHMAMTLFRGLAEDMELMDWLNNVIWPAEGRWVGEDFVRVGTELALLESLKHGVTCFNDMYFFPNITAEVAAFAGMRASIGIPVLKFPTNWAQNTQEYLHKGIEFVLNQYLEHELIKVTLAPHAPYTVDDDGFMKILQLSADKNLKIHLHLHETEFEVSNSFCESSGESIRPLKRLQDLGIVNQSLIAVHMTQLFPNEISLLAQANASVVHCPCSNMKLSSGICPVAELHKAGVNVCLGTDGASSNNDLSFLSEIKTAALLDKLHSGAANALKAFEYLEMATLNGAIALGLEEKIGSVEVGKEADLVAIELNTCPIYCPIGALVFDSNTRVSNVWIRGKHILSSGTVVTLDEEKIIKNANAWAEKLATTCKQPI